VKTIYSTLVLLLGVVAGGSIHYGIIGNIACIWTVLLSVFGFMVFGLGIFWGMIFLTCCPPSVPVFKKK
jgi:hypothetical protein